MKKYTVYNHFEGETYEFYAASEDDLIGIYDDLNLIDYYAEGCLSIVDVSDCEPEEIYFYD